MYLFYKAYESMGFVLFGLYCPEGALVTIKCYYSELLQPSPASVVLLVLPSHLEFPAFVFNFGSHFCSQFKSAISLSLSVNTSAYGGHLLP